MQLESIPCERRIAGFVSALHCSKFANAEVLLLRAHAAKKTNRQFGLSAEIHCGSPSCKSAARRQFHQNSNVRRVDYSEKALSSNSCNPANRSNALEARLSKMVDSLRRWPKQRLDKGHSTALTAFLVDDTALICRSGRWIQRVQNGPLLRVAPPVQQDQPHLLRSRQHGRAIREARSDPSDRVTGFLSPLLSQLARGPTDFFPLWLPILAIRRSSHRNSTRYLQSRR